MVIKQPAAAAMLTQKSGNVVKKAILSADLGRTATKACVSRTQNGVVFIPANVKQLTVEQVRSGNFESKPTALRVQPLISTDLSLFIFVR